MSDLDHVEGHGGLCQCRHQNQRSLLLVLQKPVRACDPCQTVPTSAPAVVKWCSKSDMARAGGRNTSTHLTKEVLAQESVGRMLVAVRLPCIHS